ncbi:MAG: hypothetical protein ACTHK0_04850 [Ginsengibacter sp.]
MLKTDKENSLASYAIDARNKNYEFWKRDSLAVHLFSKELAYQKLDYTPNNPCTEYWRLAKEPADYLFSCAKYYETGVNDFVFLKDSRNEF